MSFRELAHREAFEDFMQEAKNQLGDSLKQLYLYGSVARGEETKNSDVDIFAVVEDIEQKKLLQKLAAEKGLKHSVAMSAIVKTEEEYHKIKDTSYFRNVDEEGEIYV